MRAYLFLIVALSGLLSCTPKKVSFNDDAPVYKTGDNPQWATKDFNDVGWSTIRGNTKDKVFWVRIDVNLLRKPTAQLGLKIEAFGAFDAYWDGKFIGRNGRVVSPNQKEIPGAATSYFSLPDSLVDVGPHVVALRASQCSMSSFQRNISVGLSTYENLLKFSLTLTSFMNIIAGAFLMAAIYYLFSYINSKKKHDTVLIFSIICFLFFVLLAIEYIKYYIDIPYTHFFWRLEFIGWLTFALAMLVPLYFAIQFKFKRTRIMTGLLLITLMAIYISNFGHYDITAIYYSYTMWIFSLIIVFTAIYQKEKGAIIVLIGLLLRILINQYLFYDFSLFISFGVIVLCMLYLHTIQMKIIEEEYQTSLLLSAKLKLDLIKKNIQPHFIKNTLTSLIDWIEESPKEGVAFIKALADEFDIMNSISNRSLISVREEIDLCKKHLSVMQFRKEIKYTWEDEGIEDEELIPPATFHTLLENGITHSAAMPDGCVAFKVSFLRGDGYKQYLFQTIAVNRSAIVDKIGGTGFLYIKSRLSESYENSWEFSSKENHLGWISSIKIKTK